MMLFSSLAILSLSTSSLAFNYVVGVGRDEYAGEPGIGFDPSRTVTNRTALPGQDTLIFSFLQGAHQVIQSSFASPCSPLPGGFSTIDQKVANGTLQGAGPIYSFPIENGSQPLWFYDAAGSNCATGSVLCVNTNETSPENCSAFRAAAIAQGGTLYAAYTLTNHAGLTPSATASATSASSTASATTSTTTAPASASIPSFTAKASSPSTSVGFSLAGAAIVGVVGLGLVW